MTERDSDKPTEGTQSKKDLIPTRRRMLELAGGAGVSALTVSGPAVADSGSNTHLEEDQIQNLAESDEDIEIEEGCLRKRAESNEELELIEEGSSDFVANNNQSADWYSIGPNNEAEIRPEGVVRSQDAFCYGGTPNIGVDVGIEWCHYGGCSYELSLCAIG